MEELKARAIPIELNPTSNVRTGVCLFAAHPLRRYFDAGLLVTLTPRSGLFGSDLVNEYLLATPCRVLPATNSRVGRQLHSGQLSSRTGKSRVALPNRLC